MHTEVDDPMPNTSTLAVWLRLGIAVASSAILSACPGRAENRPEPSPTPPGAPACIVSGCSGEVCSAENVMTTCVYRPEYACYESALCAVQPDGACGWTQTPELSRCLDEKRK